MKKVISVMMACAAVGILLLETACVDDRYDIDGGISKDITIPDNKLSLPLGDLKAQRLDSLIGTGLDILTVDENGYGISMEGKIDTIAVDLEHITVPANTFALERAFSVGDLHLDAVEVPGFIETVDLNFPKVTKANIDEDLPVIEEHASLEFSDTDFESLIEALGVSGQQQRTFENLTAHLHSADRKVPCDFTTRLPDEVKTLKRIEFCEKGSSDDQTDGAEVTITLTHPAKLSGMDRTFTLNATFPAEFELALDADMAKSGSCKLEEGARGHLNIIHFVDMKADEATSVLRFRLVSLEDVEDYHEDTDGVSVIDYKADFSYDLDYTAKGNLTLSETDDMADYKVGVDIHAALGIADADIALNPISGEFPSTIIPFEAKVNDLSYISYVGSLTFDPEKSRLTLKTSTDKSFEGFTLDANEPVIVQLPTNYHLDLVEGPEAAAWNRRTNTLTLYSLEDLLGATYVFEAEGVDFNAVVTDGSMNVKGEISIGTKSGQWKLLSSARRLSEVIDAVGPRNITLTLDETTMAVRDLDVRTDDIVETVRDTTAFDIDVPLGINLIEKAYALWPEKDIELSLNLTLTGLERTKVTAEADVLLTIPPFICVESDDPEVKVEGNLLHIVTSLDAKKCTLDKTLRVTHFDFTRLEGGCLAPVEVDGETRLQYASEVIVDGSVKVPASQISLSELSDDLSLHASIGYGDITARLFEGVLDYAPDSVETEVEIASDPSLSQMLENTSIVLSDPQIAVSLTNPLGVPLLVDLLIEGLDANGDVLTGSAIEIRNVAIHPATFDAAKNTTTPFTTHLLFAARDITVDGYETVVASGLTDFLKVVPHALRLKLVPRTDVSVTHHVDLLQSIKVAGDYKLSVPLKFDELHLKYETDKSSDIEVSFGDFSKYLSKASMSLKMNARNTIPVGLKLSLIPLDANGKELPFIHVTPVEIPAGDGSAISRNSKSVEVEFSFAADNCDFTDLARLRVSAEAFADHTEGGIALKPEQGFLLTDMVLTVIADVETNLN